MRIGEAARKPVVFFGVPTENKPVEYRGTGFLVTFREPEEWPFSYVAY